MRFLRVLACATLVTGLAAAAAADTVQEVFVCTLREGKKMSDLDKVIDEWKSVMAKLKGGESYQAWVLTPVAADNLASVVWVGQQPDMASFGNLTDQYDFSKAGQEMNAKFDKVVDCRSRSIWRSRQIK